MANLDIKLNEKLYVGFLKRTTESGSPIGIITPWGTTSVMKRRMEKVDGWTKSSKLNTVTIDNVPVSGFRVSDQARRNGWGGGATVIQIADPRGFEIEISVDNMIQIMTNNIIVDGEIKVPCVWGQDGAVNILLPTNSEPYKNAVENTERVKQTFSMRGVKPGNKIEMKDGRIAIYYGTYYQFNRQYYSQHYTSNQKDRWNTPLRATRNFNRIAIDSQKWHIIQVIENKAVDDFKPHLECLKAVKVARQLDATAITIQDAETYVNNSIIGKASRRDSIAYTASEVQDFKIVVEDTTADQIREAYGPKSNWAYGRGIFLASPKDNKSEILLGDSSTLLDIGKPFRYIPGRGNVHNDTKVYGFTVNLDNFLKGDYETPASQYGATVDNSPQYKGYDELDLTYQQPYIVFTSEKTGITHKMPL